MKLKTLLSAAIIAAALVTVAQAGSATWDLNPSSGDWNTATNWTPMTVPNGPGDIATFDLSDTTNISTSATTQVNRITFNPGASAFTFDVTAGAPLTLTGTGVINSSSSIQTVITDEGTSGFGSGLVFINAAAASNLNISNSGTSTGCCHSPGSTTFDNTSSADSATITNNGGTANGSIGGLTFFNGNSTAGSATITNKPGAVGGAGAGVTSFHDSSSAGSATITNDSSTVDGAGVGGTEFFDTSTAGSTTITNNGATSSLAFGGLTEFWDFSSAGSATLIANGGTSGGAGGAILFLIFSDGGTSQVELFGNGKLDISSHIGDVTVGSIEGDGNVFLGGRNGSSLTVGSNNLDTTFSGVIQDGGLNGGTGGSLTKIGTGTLILSGANTYTGNTNINGGVLQVDGSIASNTFVNRGGTLAGTGTVNGSVTNNFGGTVSPGDAPGTLTVNSYTQMNGGTLLIDIAGSNAGDFSVLNVLGAANLDGILDPLLLNNFVPTVGEQFVFLMYGSHSGSFSSIQNQTFDNGMEQWVVTYESAEAILTVESTTSRVSDSGSTLLLSTFGLFGVVMHRRQLARRKA